uniref:Glycosyltransferase n=1 Tax=viral metagenome TaxID=1070528 RepID=A0A6C0EIP9_9ZZZZ
MIDFIYILHYLIIFLGIKYYNRYIKIKNKTILIDNKSNYNIYILSYGIKGDSSYNLCNEYINSLDIVKKCNKLIFLKYHTKKNNIFNFKRALKSLGTPINDKIIIIYNSSIDPNNMLLTLNNFDYNFIIINIEQVSRKIVLNNLLSIDKNNCKNITLCDYSYANIELLKNNNIKSMLLPYGIYKNEIYNFEKNIDISTISFKSEECVSRRSHIYNLLINNFKDVVDIKGWVYERDKLLFRSKILINVHHFTDYTIFEEIRCNRCIFNKIIVISEYSYKWENFPLKEHMIFTDYDNIINKTKEVLNNYDYYHNLLFKNLKYV